MALLRKNALLPSFPKPDFAVFAETQAQPPDAYETVKWLRTRLSYPIHTVTAGNLAAKEATLPLQHEASQTPPSGMKQRQDPPCVSCSASGYEQR